MTHTVVVMDSEEVGRTRRYQVRPGRLLAAWGGSLFVVALVVAALLVFTPLRTFIPGYGTEEIRRNARLNALRVSALQDSIAVQRHYIKRLQQLVTGQVDTMAQRPAEASSQGGLGTEQSEPSALPSTPTAGAEEDETSSAHEQPAIATTSFPASGEERETARSSSLTGLSLPVNSPVDSGFPTRSFDAQDEHYGIDVAVSEGAHVRAVGDGYVVLADWTQDGGYTIAVQHADGYLSVYKHNKRLLKQIGDRVQAQDALAVSGNTGEITTGPHVHFELWRNGLAQNPRPYVTGW